MEYAAHTLPNGLRMAHLPSESAVAYCGFAVNAGARDEGPSEHGLAHFVEHMLFKGTERHRANYILNRMETVGGELNAYTTKEETFVYAVFMHGHFRRAFELLADLVFHSTFPEAQVCKEKDVILDEIRSYEDSPSELIFDDFENLLFRGHALGHHILGGEESLSSFGPVSGKSFMRRFYTPGNMVFFSMGNVPFGKIVRWAEQLAGDIPASARPLSREAPDAAAPESRLVTKDTHQAHVMMGCRGYSMFDDRRIPLFLLNNILGGPGMNNRLNLSLREHNGLAYEVESNAVSYTDTGAFSIYFGTDPRKWKRAMSLVRRELDRLCEEKLSDRRLEAAKKQALGQLGVSADNRESLFLNLGKSYLHYNRFDSMEELSCQIGEVSAESIRQTAGELFHPERLSTLVYD